MVCDKKYRQGRIVLLAGFVLLWVAALVGRLFYLQISDVTRWQEWALKQHFAELEVASERGPILDRNGKMVAVSVPAGSVYIRRNEVKEAKKVAKVLAKHLKLQEEQVAGKLQVNSPFVWVRRQVPKHVARAVAKHNLKGVGYILEPKRYYPYNNAGSSLIGRVGVDGTGLSGLEAKYERYLQTAGVTRKMTRDAFGNMILDVTDHGDTPLELPKGSSLQLTIDGDIQEILSAELERGREDANAKAAMAVMIDAETGEILAMSQAPEQNYNTGNLKGTDALRNRVVETVFEPGSIMKPMVAAAAIEVGAVSPTDTMDCEEGQYRFGGRLIKDVHPNSKLSVRDIVVRSSNIGMTKIAQQLGQEALIEGLRQFGFGAHSGLGLPGETAGILRPLSRWRQIDLATHSFGQGVAVTALQVVRAVSVIANGGRLPSLSLTSGPIEPGERVISAETAAKVREMMYGVVSDPHGTGKRAAIDGVLVGGKTGTAQKPKENGRGYADGKYIASFVGFVDGESVGVNRTLSLIVMIDEPDTTSIYGGTLAGPVFKRVMTRTLHYLSTRAKLGDSGPNPRHSPESAVDHGFYRVGYQPALY